ncbi:quinoprotein dehydrogenase-associated SoxYZ-like carrier [Sedimentitalea sp. JM2-8]|uniref:Quinoprotein dehydrogenase-associated SoxYZ-like carrier n=1 Tax=Sedimentitalea xiamensis TaxID=3050037 RepID=A0ABT7FD96_9RHOB|nr:quinoprotein dehydrogenase-associated SoxYZ-like carrier [Sedimentitalea xiamensis]MDK3073090.1 quinoprotein dehydrogenase-associated SoxYZ-like carrier [Sedimentitalea xiamensis]
MLKPLALLFSLTVGTAAFAGDLRTPLADPMQSGMWTYHQKELLGDPERIGFDARVIVSAPDNAEDTVNVPLLVDATQLDDVEEILIFADYGPIPHILTYYPGSAEPKIALRFKIDQATAIRASVRTSDGAWHVGSTYVDAAGGGCTAASHAYASDDWEQKLGNIHGKVWADSGRARLIVDHPMDTGLADGIPVFIIQSLDISDVEGAQLARLELHEPVNEDPAFTLYFPPASTPDALRISGRDNNGNVIDGLITVAGYNG